MFKFKRILVTSLAAGAAISAVLMGADRLTGFAFLDWQMPGITAAYFFWGAVSSSTNLGFAIAWMVNAVVYAVLCLIVLSVMEVLRTIATR